MNAPVCPGLTLPPEVAELAPFSPLIPGGVRPARCVDVFWGLKLPTAFPRPANLDPAVSSFFFLLLQANIKKVPAQGSPAFGHHPQALCFHSDWRFAGAVFAKGLEKVAAYRCFVPSIAFVLDKKPGVTYLHPTPRPHLATFPYVRQRFFSCFILESRTFH